MTKQEKELLNNYLDKIEEYNTLISTTKDINLCNMFSLLDYLGLNWSFWVDLRGHRGEFDNTLYIYLKKQETSLKIALNELLQIEATHKGNKTRQSFMNKLWAKHLKYFEYELKKQEENPEIKQPKQDNFYIISNNRGKIKI